MALPSEHVEGMIGRRAATCLGWVLLILTILMIAALVWSWTRSNEKPQQVPVRSE